MAAQPQIDPQVIISEAPRTRWSRGVRIAFRFCFLYFGLYCATTQVLSGMLPIPDTVIEIPLLSVLPPIKPLVFWTAAHVFGVSTPLVFTGSGSGDKTFDWVLAFCALVFAVLATAAWSALDRKRESHAQMQLQLFDRNKLLLVSRGFHWIQEYPFNR